MHVQRTGESRADVLDIEIALVAPERWLLLHQPHQLRFTAADERKIGHRAELPKLLNP